MDGWSTIDTISIYWILSVRMSTVQYSTVQYSTVHTICNSNDVRSDEMSIFATLLVGSHQLKCATYQSHATLTNRGSSSSGGGSGGSGSGSGSGRDTY